MKTSLSKLWKTEDWLAVWIGFIIISAGIVSVLTGAFDFSAAKFSTWHLWEDVAEKNPFWHSSQLLSGSSWHAHSLCWEYFSLPV